MDMKFLHPLQLGTLLLQCALTFGTDVPQIGAYYYPWWGNPQNPHWQDGYLREYLEPQPQEPMLGEYFNHDPAVTDQHLQWAHQYGITQLVAAWFGPNRFGDTTIQDYLLGSEQRGTTGIQIGLLYESQGRFEQDPTDNKIYFNTTTTNEQQLLDDFTYMAENYFGKPGYLKVKGKPVVYLYLTRTYRGDYADAFARMKSFILHTYDYELYLLADVVYWERPDPDQIRIYDAVTAYNMHGPAEYDGYPEDTGFLVDVEAKYPQYQVTANELQVDFIPGIMPAYNDRGVRLETGHYAIPHEISRDKAGTGQYSTFQESLQMAQRVLQSQTTGSTSTIMITSWNEWHEDTNIEPTKGTAGSTALPETFSEGFIYEDYGFSLLQVVADFLQPFNSTSQTPFTERPSTGPSEQPMTTSYPTISPTIVPSIAPIATPIPSMSSNLPSLSAPTLVPTSGKPTVLPTSMPSTIAPSTNTPTNMPGATANPTLQTPFPTSAATVTTTMPAEMPFLSTFPPSTTMFPQQKVPPLEAKCGSLATNGGYGGAAGQLKGCDSGGGATKRPKIRGLRRNFL